MNFNIPNDLFSNIKGKGRESNGILDIFDRFNFTINEAEPLEKDVAVDPEMLGKIFENLLDVKDRKSKGAFYTPREIVHYMCQESLTNYLVKEVGVPYADMKEFIEYGDLIKDADNRRNVGYSKELKIKDAVFQNILEIDQSLKKVTVADPAVGSGAFPLGMLSEIVRIRNNITDYLVRKDKEGALKRKFGEHIIRKNRSPYRLKRETIKNSIFAVDIEPSAVDIAKLRLWLSVIVEQEITEETPDPHPLPNLDLNIMVGNSLIDEYEGIKLFDERVLFNKMKSNESDSMDLEFQLSFLIDNSDEILEKMFRLQDRYFDEENENRKRDIKSQIDELREDLIEYKLNLDENEEAINKHKKFQENKTKPYFLWQLEFAKVFQEKKGFDIVIGNPPYLKEMDSKDIFQEITKTSFGKKYSEGKMNFWYYFFYKGLDILKRNGHLCFIAPNYFINGDGAKKLNKKIVEETKIKLFIDFNKTKVFESADIQCMILNVEKEFPMKEAEEGNIYLVRKNFATSEVPDLMRTIESNSNVNHLKLANQNLILSKNGRLNFEYIKYQKVLDKLNTFKTDEKLFKATQGVVENPSVLSKKNLDNMVKKEIISEDDIGHKYYVGEEVFVISKSNIDSLQLNTVERSFLREYHEPNEINNFTYIKAAGKYVLYLTKNNISDINIYPNLKKHLEKYRIFMEERRETKKGTIEWFHLHWPRNEDIFLNEKILFPQMGRIPKFAYCDEPYFVNMSTSLIYKLNETIDLLILTGILNSELGHFYLLHNAKNRGVGLDIGVNVIDNFPVSLKMLTEEKDIRIIVKKIIDYKEQGLSTEELEMQLNKNVYKSYGISEGEQDLIKSYIKERLE